MDIKHWSFSESSDSLLRELHEAAKVTRSKRVLEALNRAANEYWRLVIESSTVSSDIPLIAEDVLQKLAKTGDR